MNMNNVMQCTGTSCIYCINTFGKLDEDNIMLQCIIIDPRSYYVYGKKIHASFNSSTWGVKTPFQKYYENHPQ